MKEIEVSIVIPIYNVERYVRKTIESVQCQDFDAYEIILVDDGSEDSSGTICDEYATKDSRITVIHQSNGGVMSARLAGVYAAKGKYIAFLDGDDRMPKSAISCMYKSMEKESADILKGACYDIDINGNILSDVIYQYNNFVITNNHDYRRWLSKNLRGMNIGMYRKSILLQDPIVKVDRRIVNNEDHIFNLFLATRINKAVFISDVVALIVIHKDSISNIKKDSNYWLFLLKWVSNNYKTYDVFLKDFILFKLRIIFLRLLLEEAPVDYNEPIFRDVKKSSYSMYYGAKLNIALFAIKNPYNIVLSLFKLRPNHFLKTFLKFK